MVKKGRGVEGVRFALMDENRGGDSLLMEFVMPRSDLPGAATSPGEAEWTEFSMSSEAGAKEAEGVELVFRVMVTDGSLKISSDADMKALIGGNCDDRGLSYSEEVIECCTGDVEDSALMQCFRHDPDEEESDGAADRAVLWIIGRNDCFMHPHVARGLFFQTSSGKNAKKYDLYVLNYCMNGATRRRGWVPDPHLNSHCRSGSFGSYAHEIERSLEIIADFKSYGTVLGYAHSTGAPVLLDYLLTKGDDDFDGFVFNSPFLDWGFVGGDLAETVLENVGLLEHIEVMHNDDTLGEVATTPDSIKDTPLVYLDKEVVLSDWSARIWSQYHFNWGDRPLYKVPLTVGFARGVTDVHRRLETAAREQRAVTTKPFLVITSRGDDVLKSTETISRADWIGPSRCEVELNDNGHDIFLSHDERDTALAIDMVRSWMRNRGF